ncbi:MAG: hypothetical protein Q7T26_04270 [Dehalococcoidia bacterium]|nr:hypothetical protein [Dehalococcoidia bacterium]
MQLFKQQLTINNPLDFESPGLTEWQQLRSVHSYLSSLAVGSTSPSARQEIAFAQAECAELLSRWARREAVSHDAVHRQIERARRVARHHEGLANRALRRYWWAFAILLLVALFSLGHSQYEPDWSVGPIGAIPWSST